MILEALQQCGGERGHARKICASARGVSTTAVSRALTDFSRACESFAFHDVTLTFVPKQGLTPPSSLPYTSTPMPTGIEGPALNSE